VQTPSHLTVGDQVVGVDHARHGCRACIEASLRWFVNHRVGTALRWGDLAAADAAEDDDRAYFGLWLTAEGLTVPAATNRLVALYLAAELVGRHEVASGFSAGQ